MLLRSVIHSTLFTLSFAWLCVGITANIFSQQTSTGSLGSFEGQTEVGTTPLKGGVKYNPATEEYTVTGGGGDIFGTSDAFHYLWKRVSGDVTLTADVHFIGTSAARHRKAVLMVRQSLEPDAVYVDAALHGDGLTALQYRQTAGAKTLPLRSPENAPTRIRLERRGNQFTVYAGKTGEEFVATGPVTVSMQDPVYVGLGVSSHNPETVETAVFSNVKIESALHASPNTASQAPMRSKISIYDIRDKSVHVIYTADTLFEAPNWSPDGRYLLANSGGSLYRFILNNYDPTVPRRINLYSAYRANNDHGLSPDGKLLAFSAVPVGARGSEVYVASADGSDSRLLVPTTPSYFHGWSPDGKWLAIVGERNGNFDIYRVPAGGGKEERLTTSSGYDDGPDYSPDGKWIYINSDRSGSWDIWRIPAHGAGPNDAKAERVSHDDLEDWFPHPSPDGKWIVFLSFPHGTKGHNAKVQIQIRILAVKHDKIKPNSLRMLTSFFGGQGTINVNSWSPDSTRFAFVSYEPLP